MTDADGNWAVRGFVDVWRKIFPMTSDTKVLSKVIEMILLPIFLEAIEGLPVRVEYAAFQNHYPDITVLDNDTGAMVAVDLKSTYRTSATEVNGFTLGAFTGYFRDRASTKNTLYPYGEYDAHLVLGVIYSKLPGASEAAEYSIDDIDRIPAVANDFVFLVQPKWAIATDRPGSGNTKNIGSVTNIDQLREGRGPFVQFEEPEEVFDDYWMHYLTTDMALAADTASRYKNLKDYLNWKQPPKLRK